jgi:hypothetical protein
MRAYFYLPDADECGICGAYLSDEPGKACLDGRFGVCRACCPGAGCAAAREEEVVTQ